MIETSLEFAGVTFQNAVVDGDLEKVKRAGDALLLAADRVTIIAKTELENSREESYKEELAAIIQKCEEGIEI